MLLMASMYMYTYIYKYTQKCVHRCIHYIYTAPLHLELSIKHNKVAYNVLVFCCCFHQAAILQSNSREPFSQYNILG